MPKNPSEDYLMSDEYYTAAKAKRRGLGLVEFIGELFKLDMLTEKIMHECVRRLLSNVQDPEEEETESMAKLMSTVGKLLDHRAARNYMDAYFHRIQELSVNQKLSSRIRFMLLDLIELRNDKWVPRRAAAGPKTIAQIHEEALKQKQEAEAMRRAKSGGGRTGGGSGGPPMGQHLNRSDSRGGNSNRGGDGWSTVGGGATRKVNDLSSFGNLARSKTVSTGMSLGPGGNVFNALGGGAKGGKTEPAKDKEEGKPGSNRSSIIGTGNMFSALMGASPPASGLKEAH
ncbi:armadillo-type protein [Syncephalis fuscata]|nr:armadillo-type protein [Syncephalis fuscata]